MKTLDKLSTEGMYLNVIKAVCDKPTANIMLKGGILKTFSLRLDIRQVPTLTTPV